MESEDHKSRKFFQKAEKAVAFLVFFKKAEKADNDNDNENDNDNDNGNGEEKKEKRKGNPRISHAGAPRRYSVSCGSAKKR